MQKQNAAPAAAPATAAYAQPSVQRLASQTAQRLSSQFPNMPVHAPISAPSGPSASYKVAPLRLDEQGREIDESGKVIERKQEAIPTLKV